MRRESGERGHTQTTQFTLPNKDFIVRDQAFFGQSLVHDRWLEAKVRT